MRALVKLRAQGTLRPHRTIGLAKYGTALHAAHWRLAEVAEATEAAATVKVKVKMLVLAAGVPQHRVISSPMRLLHRRAWMPLAEIERTDA